MKKLTLVLSMMLALVGLNANAAMWIVGDAPFAGWHTNSGTSMVDNGDGTYSYVVTIENKTVYFSFADGLTANDGDWTGFQAYRFGPTSDGQNVNAGEWVTTQHSGNAYKFFGNGEYEITFDATNTRFKIEGYVAPVEITTYTVVSGLDGDDWPILEANDMTLANGVYTLTRENVELTAGTLAYKIVGNHDWGFEWPQGYGNNFTQEIPANGIYDITFTFDPATEEATCTLNPVQEMETFYTVAGTPAAIFGEEWNPNYAANNMTLVDGLYTWTKTGVEATDTTVVEFKVVANGNWNTCWPLSDENGDNNKWYQFPETGTYDMVITFNEETKEINLTATKQGGEEPVEDTYTVAGTQNLFGSDWDPADEANNMVKGEDGIYSWTKEEVTLYGNFEFKVVGNHDYAVYEWPMGPNNWVANLTEGEGVYTVAITFNPEAADSVRIACTLTKTADITPVEHTYTVAGTENLFGSNWDQTDEANDMDKGENGIYTWTKDGVEFAAEAVVEFKVVQDHAWDYAWPSSNWWWQCTEDGTYNVVITFDPAAEAGQEITFTATKVEVPAILRGDVNQDNAVNITDVTSLINLLLKGGENPAEADCNEDGNVNITDVTTLINYLLKGQW